MTTIDNQDIPSEQISFTYVADSDAFWVGPEIHDDIVSAISVYAGEDAEGCNIQDSLVRRNQLQALIGGLRYLSKQEELEGNLDRGMHLQRLGFGIGVILLSSPIHDQAAFLKSFADERRYTWSMQRANSSQ